MNEGHSAFLALERIRLNVDEKKLNFYSALQVVAAANVFTTHTPVPAGNDSFSREMMQKYFGKIRKGTKRSIRRAVFIRPHAS
jgi:starch phosphorylase